MTSFKTALLLIPALLLLSGCSGRTGINYVCLDGELASDLADCKPVKTPANSSGCILSAGISCASAKLSKDGYLALKIKNDLPGEIAVTGVYCTENAEKDARIVPQTEWTNLNRTIPQGASADLVLVPCRNANGLNQQFDENQSFSGSVYLKHYFTITPDEERIALGELDLQAKSAGREAPGGACAGFLRNKRISVNAFCER